MTAEIVDVPPRARQPLPAESAPATGGAPQWRAVVRRCVLVPLIVLVPLVTLTPSADHRFNLYGNGGQYYAHPWRMVRTAVASVPQFLDLGNFRPLGRLVEWTLDTAVFALTALFGIPANIGLRLVSFAGAIVLTVAAVVFAEAVISRRERLFGGPPSALAAVLPFAVATGLVAAGRTSTTVLFGGLYLTTSALVLAVAAWACRSRRAGVLVVLTGAGLAAFNELAYLAVPLATATLLLRRRVVLGDSWRSAFRGRFLALLWAGFLPVFVPVRVLIWQRCAGGGCYSGSDIALGGAPAALPNRLVSWLPPLMWQRATGKPFPPLAEAIPVLAFVALAVLAWRAARTLPRPAGLDRRQAFGLAAVALVLLVLAGALAALNADMQKLAAAGIWGQGWRDSGLTTVAGSLLVLALWRRVTVVALAVLVLAGTVGAAANKDYRELSAGGRFPYLHDRIAQEVADFDRTPAGDARRCALRAAFIATSTVDHKGVLNYLEVERFDVSIDRATRQLAGRPFCSAAAR